MLNIRLVFTLPPIDSTLKYKRCIDLWNNFSCIIPLEFNEIEIRLKSAKNRFQLSAGLNLETLNTILSGTNHI